jgi:hypothetical protein
MAARLYLTLCALHVGRAIRVEDWGQRQQLAVNSADPDDGVTMQSSDAEVDFSFMTQGDFRRPAVASNFWTWMHKIFGRRRDNKKDVKEEIAFAHHCAKDGNAAADDQVYYASSFCYWLPDITQEEEIKPDIGLNWVNGRDVPRKPLCGGLSGAGKCMKCTSCHNNALSRDSMLSFTTQAEDLTGFLPPSCKKETEIERHCLSEFEKENTDLSFQNKQCIIAKGKYETAITEYEETVSEIAMLNDTIARLPGEISNLEEEIARQEGIINASETEGQTARNNAYSDCEDLQLVNGFSRWYSQLQNFTLPIDELMKTILLATCVHGTPSFYACRTCTVAINAVEVVSKRKEAADAATRVAQEEKLTKETQLEDSQTLRNNLVSDVLPVKQQAKIEAENAWFPNRDNCEEKMQKFIENQAAYIKSCALTQYDSSCEKACSQLLHVFGGCGVVEGASIADENGRGGVALTCKPPQASWIHGPWNYGAEKEGFGHQCGRLGQGQLAQRAIRLLKKGWMKKGGRWFGWKDRYFFLESGDEVHSGILYYYENNPAEIGGQNPRHDKRIILWDARHVVANFGWSDCFTLNHFYRNYKFCAGDKEDETDWVEKIDQEIHRAKPTGSKF